MLQTQSQAAASSITQILATRGVVPHFQPIVSVRQKSIVGVEALSRGSDGGGLIGAPTLFRMAEQAGLREALGRICREEAIRRFSQIELPSDLLLFLNLDVPARRTPKAIAQDLRTLTDEYGLSPAMLAIEILETEFTDTARLRALTGALRDHGYLIALDDVGAGHSNLDRIPLIHPDVMKVDRTLISGIDVDHHKRGTLKSVIELSRQIGALVVVEGIEDEEEAIVCLELGADLLQGYFLCRPTEHARLDDRALAQTFDRVSALARSFRDHMVGKINDRRLRHRRFNVIVNQMLCDLTGAEVERFDDILQNAISRYPSVECAYVLDQSGVQVTDTVCNPSVPRRDNGILFRPASRGTDHSLKEYYYILLDVELHKFTTDPYVSLASGNVSRTISTYFRDALSNSIYVLCVDVHD